MSEDTAVTDRIVDAFLGRLATTPLGAIELSDVARDAGVGLEVLRAHFDGKLAILAAHARRVDLAVLARHDPAMAGEPARDRLFDVLMRRLDVLAPHRDAMRMLARSVTRDPLLAAAIGPIAVRSMTFMLSEAGIPAAGAAGRLRARGLALAWVRILDVFVDDHDPGLARTMVAVDKALRRGEQAEDLLDRARRVACRFGGNARRGRDRGPAAAEDVSAGAGI